MGELKGRSVSIFVVTVVFLVLSFVAVALRCFARLRLVRAFGWDDSLMVLAMALNILFAICGMTGSFYGIGRKMEELIHDIPGIEKALFWWWLGQASYVFTCVIAKMSIALALLRLTISRVHQAILWTVIGVSVVVGLAFWLTLILQCHPVSFFWHRFTTSGTCINLNYLEGVAYLYSVTAVICDFILALLPIALVWTLQMNFRTKAALAAILGLGCIASTAVIVRIPYLHYYKDADFLYATADISIWSNVEAGLGITAGSLVTVRSLFRFFRGSGYEDSGSRTASELPLSRINMNGANRTRSGEEMDELWWLEVEAGQGETRSTTRTSTSRLGGQEDLKHIGGTFLSLTASDPGS
ncbi:uncharacterized protein APUU_60305A [Aspergillus puulaauensis]|uniref:Rhodopsin domain-containing protein n=1 Tax=Aspergillus puulaauensis TaxID=1220207 RepID=A0A7R7XTU2_9EURO|nr:uncharacterized protein APUU_60305A [Aspergillus puulaauensis]BCS27257.1 hypothetical protein APUU_60305A [Aspergillus puulaauensis]